VKSQQLFEGKKILRTLQIKHFFYFCIFILGAAVRLIAVFINPITQSEAIILLNSVNESSIFSVSPLLSALINTSFFLFGNSLIPIRIVSAIAGSLILLTPLLFENYWGEKEGIGLSIFFAIDPFLISNAIQFNGISFTILFFLIAGAMYLREKMLLFFLSLFMILLSGNYLIPLILMSGVVICVEIISANGEISTIKNKLINKKKILNDQIQFYKYHLLSALIFVFIILVLTNTNISSIIDILIFDTHMKKIGGVINPGLIFVSLVSYYPLGMIGFIRIIFDDISSILHNKKWVFSIIVLSYLLIILLPKYSVLELAWVTIPVAFLLSKLFVQDLSRIINYGREALFWMVPLMVVVIDLILILIRSVSPYSTSFINYPTMLAVIIGLLIIIMIVIFMSYLRKPSFAKDIILACVGLVFLTFHLSFAWRSAGFGAKPEMEILWDGGYFTDHARISSTIDHAIEKKHGTNARISIVNYSKSNPALVWVLGKYSKKNEQSIASYRNTPIIVSESEYIFDGLFENYRGQSFVVNEKPQWMATPFKSMVTRDYWNWLFYRIAPPQKEEKIIWINRAYFPDFIEVESNT